MLEALSSSVPSAAFVAPADLFEPAEEAQARELAQSIVQQTPRGINDNEAVARAHKLLGR
ncbi:MAG: hypothetical protein IT464_15275 [Planctomycetes bacterium]|nr:hypothetical protein [Planctomycetota bacterium]